MSADLFPLVVDVDGSLIRTDLGFEAWFAAAGRMPATAARCLGVLKDGRAAFKRRLAEHSVPDAALLPYRPEVLALIDRARADGRPIALASGSDRAWVAAVAAHLGGIDRIFASDGKINLTGPHKADALVSAYGERGFDYVGNARVDLAVWQRARRAYTVDLTPKLARRVERLGVEVTHLAARPDLSVTAQALWAGLRPHQWAKNTLVFLPVLAAHSLAFGEWLAALMIGLSLCLAASGIYLINDMIDLEADRRHPRKRHRPLAAGHVPGALAAVVAVLCIVAAVWLAVWGVGAGSGLAVLGYVLVSLAYTGAFKRLVAVDIAVLAGLYAARVAIGGLAASIPLSGFLVAFSLCLFLSLAAIKRQTELVDAKARGLERVSRRGYRTADLWWVTALAVAAGLAAAGILVLYALGDTAQTLYATPTLLLAIAPALVAWLGWMIVLSRRGRMHDDPVAFALTDRTSLAAGISVAFLAVSAALVPL